MEEFLTYMKEQGWIVELNEKREEHRLPQVIRERYISVPQQWMDFISAVKSLINDDDTSWFLCGDDFDLQKEHSFRWNEWEIISLESAESDTEWETKIREFWNIHLPIIMSVEGGYSYYAISMENGSIVYGNEPEFEECKVVANSFEDFLLKIMKCEISI